MVLPEYLWPWHLSGSLQCIIQSWIAVEHASLHSTPICQKPPYEQSRLDLRLSSVMRTAPLLRKMQPRQSFPRKTEDSPRSLNEGQSISGTCSCTSSPSGLFCSVLFIVICRDPQRLTHESLNTDTLNKGHSDEPKKESENWQMLKAILWVVASCSRRGKRSTNTN